MRLYMDIINESARLAESTGAECEFIEWKPGQWYYAFERFVSDEGKYNWRDEDVDCYGPFESYEKANADLVANHANPGGHNTLDHDDVKKSHYINEYKYWVEHAEAPQVREDSINERAISGIVFDGTDLALDRDFQTLCTSLGFHESAQQSLMRRLERDGHFSRQIDPRDVRNKYTPEQWASLNQQLRQHFQVQLENGILTITTVK